jgi:hypothetical protein
VNLIKDFQIKKKKKRNSPEKPYRFITVFLKSGVTPDFFGQEEFLTEGLHEKPYRFITVVSVVNN